MAYQLSIHCLFAPSQQERTSEGFAERLQELSSTREAFRKLESYCSEQVSSIVEVERNERSLHSREVLALQEDMGKLKTHCNEQER